MIARDTHSRGASATLAAVLALGIAVAAPALAEAKRGKPAKASLDRPEAAVVVEGSELPPAFTRIHHERVVAFKYRVRRGHGGWRQVPLQVDERVEVDFGEVPDRDAVGGTPGTVYGTEPAGVTALQYADPFTFVGGDPNFRLDVDDKVAVMAKDAGARAPRKRRPPAASSRTSSRGSSSPIRSTAAKAGSTYPERSTAFSEDSYLAGFSDRWIWNELHLGTGVGAPDVLDGLKFGMAPGQCGHSEDTFSGTDTNDRPNDRAEGAFVAGIDGPVRAIRSYVGANSGPYTQRTHYFYETSHTIETDLRVHPIPGLFSHLDLSRDAIGMTYRNSSHRGGVRVDGVPDPIGEAVPSWHLWSGQQGSLFAAERVSTSYADELDPVQRGYYLDDSTPADRQCWGDDAAFGAAGIASAPPAGIPNTDPRLGQAETVHATETTIMSPSEAGAVDAERWSDRLDSPLGVSVRERR